MLRFLMLLLLITTSILGMAQVQPAEDDTTNYRLAGFRIGDNFSADKYVLEIAAGRILDEDAFVRNIIVTKEDVQDKILAIVPEFNKAYTWRLVYRNKHNKIIKKSSLHHFTTGTYVYADTANYRLKVINKKTPDCPNVYVFIDEARSLFDLEGNLLWFMPTMQNTSSSTDHRDIRPAADESITAIVAARFFNIDYDGNVLYSVNHIKKDIAVKLNLDSFEVFHHEVFMLANGNYMAAFRDVIQIAVDTMKVIPGKMPIMKDDNGNAYRRLMFGGILELDNKGNVVWSWRAADHLLNDTVFVKPNPRNIMDMSPHMNSFFFDSLNKKIYISFRNIDRIVRIGYPGGAIERIYNGRDAGTKFKAQHNVTANKGEIMLFNNNIAFEKEVDVRYDTSYVSIYSETINDFRKKWEVSCGLDTFAAPGTPTGGSALFIDDKNMLVCVGAAGRVFIIDMNKNIKWNAVFQTRNDHWKATGSGYRANFVDERHIKAIIFRENVK